MCKRFCLSPSPVGSLPLAKNAKHSPSNYVKIFLLCVFMHRAVKARTWLLHNTHIAAVRPNHFLNGIHIHAVRPANFLQNIAAVSDTGNSAVSARL